MGFSAGGFLAAQTSNIVEPTYKPVDSADKLSSRPDFAIAFYPGHLCREGGALEPSIKVSKHTPPTFLLQAWDDDVDPVCNSTIYARALNAAGVPAFKSKDGWYQSVIKALLTRQDVIGIMRVNALVHTAVVTDMAEEAFHDAMEGLAS